MTKFLILLLGLSMTLALVVNFGIISIAVCFALALGTLLFSTEAAEGEDEMAMAGASFNNNRFGSPSTFMGGL
ncbi:MAG: hypothetical protein ACRYGA_08890 [Janthinobacterium lividum]